MRTSTVKIPKAWIESELARGLADVASEMRLVDLSKLVEMIQKDEATNISDFVNSSTELFFRPSALRYGLLASVDMRWDSRPSVRLDMEFRFDSVTVFFKIILGHSFAGVEVMDACFDDERLSPDDQSRSLALAIDRARLAPARNLAR